MSLVPDEPAVNTALKEKGVQYTIGELRYNAALCPECVAELLELFRVRFSLYMRVALAEAIFARKPKGQQKRQAVEILLAVIRENPERSGTLSTLVDNELAKNVAAVNARELGEMLFQKEFGYLRPGFACALGKIGNAEAISYLVRGGQDHELAACSLNALARLEPEKAQELCENALKIPGVKHSDWIQETYSKLQRQLKRKTEVSGPTHMTKASIPTELEEWSTNLDQDELPKVLRGLEACFESGFSQSEIAEIVSKADALSVGKTVRFKFAVRYLGKEAACWVEVFCDDEDAFDLYIFASPELIAKIDPSLERILK